MLDAGEYGPKWVVANVAEALGTTTRSLEYLKKRFVEQGIPAAIERKKRQPHPGKFNLAENLKLTYWHLRARRLQRVGSAGLFDYWRETAC